MAAQSLAFQETTFDVIDRNGQPWLKAADIARALGYAAEDAVSRIYRRNSDEFTQAMSQTVNLTVCGEINGLQHKTIRIFSLRGAHLIAMFARTKVAKAFRRWVLDILDRVTYAPSALTTADERSPLRAAVSLLVGKRSLMYPEAYALVHQRFGVEHIDQLTPEQTTQAVEYVHRLVLEGEVLPAAKVTQPLDLPSIEFPHLPGMIGSIGFMTAGNLIGMRHGGASPIGKLLRLLGERGYDTAAMKVEYNGLYHALESFESCLERIARETDGTRRLGMRVDFRPVIVE
ncbi:BRO-N domain-containing protein [Laribacter hongkongensis]|uniref:BRO-N domain-containing protein n=1 Tax=Laribacter hongkongensis TaxID=168471 RepID=UPI001EFC6510|nr:BRO family protein [Laribacter hongkongensis]MCG9078911.1 hypothetical protein [Laribacter hongkongensis]